MNTNAELNQKMPAYRQLLCRHLHLHTHTDMEVGSVNVNLPKKHRDVKKSAK